MLGLSLSLAIAAGFFRNLERQSWKRVAPLEVSIEKVLQPGEASGYDIGQRFAPTIRLTSRVRYSFQVGERQFQGTKDVREYPVAVPWIYYDAENPERSSPVAGRHQPLLYLLGIFAAVWSALYFRQNWWKGGGA
ncbi:MAG: hypothetical protein KDD47_25885 [Acidobacteria bacterium]|nr:hypothetical protein [Acidobacteriota bacterium]